MPLASGEDTYRHKHTQTHANTHTHTHTHIHTDVIDTSNFKKPSTAGVSGLIK